MEDEKKEPVKCFKPDNALVTIQLPAFKKFKSICYARAKKEKKTISQFITDVLNSDIELNANDITVWKKYTEIPKPLASFITIETFNINRRIWIYKASNMDLKLRDWALSKIALYLKS